MNLRDIDSVAKRRHLLGPLYERCKAGPSGQVSLTELQRRTCTVNRENNTNINVNDLIRMCELRWGNFTFPGMCCVCMENTAAPLGTLQPCGHEVHAQCLRRFYEHRLRGLTDAAPTEDITCPICYNLVSNVAPMDFLMNTVMQLEFQSKLKRRQREDEDLPQEKRRA